ncbi:hypothetical protein AYO38_07140 [bacterium SCGC AG-212-C10]|nr:hypothetical protein AYO38_07140 [bacterium SCGC AG-212-C10]
MSNSARTAAIARLRPVVERARRNEGWDFGHLGARVVGAESGADPSTGLPWDYIARARVLASKSRRVLDLGTGGGERLSEIAAGIVATEQWHVNAPIAARRLAAREVPVVRAAVDSAIPFANASFNLVLSRHEGLDPAEVVRVLAPDGSFLTQQVDQGNWKELARHFPRKLDWGDHGTRYASVLESAGYAVDLRRAEYRVAYRSLEDFVFMVAAAPWDLPDFGLDGDIDAWLAFERDCTTTDGLVVTEGRYLLEARVADR